MNSESINKVIKKHPKLASKREKLEQMQDGAYCMHGSWGFGRIKSYDEKLANSRNSANGYKIIFTDENGHEITRQFDATEYTDSGQLLYNDITTALDEFGGAVSSDEKRQILFRILKELV